MFKIERDCDVTYSLKRNREALALWWRQVSNTSASTWIEI